MAYVDGFEHDVFLSYAQVNNSAPEGRRGWVSTFEVYLQIALDQRAGRIGAVKIWSDLSEIDGNQSLKRTIRDALDRSAVLVALNSTGYLINEDCRRQLDRFRRRASGDRIGAAAGDRLRIVNVLINNVDRGDWPKEFGGTIGFDFHDARHDNPKGEPSEIGSELFNRQLRKLADALIALLKAMRRESSPEPPPSSTVFLADVAETLRRQKQRLAEDLTLHGIEIVSGIPPPRREADHQRRVVEALAGVDLTVHLLDADAGLEIDGRQDGTTYPQRQVELAFDDPRPQLVWIPEDLDLETIEDAGQQAFLRRLECGEAGSQSYDFVRGIRANVAQQIVDKVNQIIELPETRAPCLLVTHWKDTDHLAKVLAALTDVGIKPFITQVADDPRSVVRSFEDGVRRVVRLIVFYGAVSREWVRERLDMAVKIAVLEQLSLKLGVYAPGKSPDDASFSRDFIQVQTLHNARQALKFVR